MTMTLIETKTLVSTQAAIEFVSIPQDGTDLMLLCSLRDNSGATGYSEAFVKFNSSGSGYTMRQLYGDGSAAYSFTHTDFMRIWATGAGNPSANTFSSNHIYIPNYTLSSNKSVSTESVTEGNSTAQAQFIAAGLWANSAAITSIEIDAAGANSFIAGTTVSLYKITKGTDGIVVVS